MSTPLQFYNTATRRKEPFSPKEENHARIYTCGPTVYNFAHVGNFRTYVFEDLLRRTLQFCGIRVTQVMNITDVDDKTIKGAQDKGITLDEFTAPYKEAFFDDLKVLSIEPAECYPEATAYIGGMIEMIEKLLASGHAYQGKEGNIFFSIAKFPSYGCLSHLPLDELKAGASQRVVATDEYEKDSVADFVLWKHHDKERDGPIFWESPFGPGRPGWHLECSAMALGILGDGIDIHCGGVDNIFPHHENEIAQSEAYCSKPFAHFWLHSEHLMVNNQKMSKKLGNFYKLRDLLDKGYTGTQIRYLLLQTHYRTQLNFTFEGLEGAKSAIQRLNDFAQRMQEWQGGGMDRDTDALIARASDQFTAALADDLNISPALAALFDLVREIYIRADQNELSKQGADKVVAFLKKVNQVLAVIDFTGGIEAVPAEVQDALEKRTQARQNKEWQLADELRAFIVGKGYVIEDTPQGARVKKGN